MPTRERALRIKNGIQGIDFIDCEEPGCGKEVREINRHLKVHGLTVPQYRIRHPEAPTICLATKNIRRELIGQNISLEVRQEALDTAREEGSLPHFPDRTTKELESALGRVRAEGKNREADTLLRSRSLIPLRTAGQESEIPITTLYSAAQEGRLPVEKVAIGGRTIVGVDPEEIALFKAGWVKKLSRTREIG